MKFKTKTEQETREVGKKLGLTFLNSEQGKNHALVVSLEGDLGTGKTTLTQGLAQGLGVEKWIKSPTFVLMREHVLPKESSKHRLYHIDCYRLKNSESLIELGLKDILKDKENIVLIEWGERLGDLLPKTALRIKFKHLKNRQREIEVL